MASTDTTRRQRLSAPLRSAIATAAIVGTLGGWVAFGTHSDSSVATSAQAPAQAADSSAPQGQEWQPPAALGGVGGNGSTTSPGGVSGSGSTTAPSQSTDQGGFNGNGSTTAPSQPTLPSRGRRGPVTGTRSSR